MMLYTDHPANKASSGSGRRRNPDPIEELATIDEKSPDNNPDRPHLSVPDGPQPGFGPDGTKQPKFSGDPTLGIDPREAAARLGDGD
jgi:hypothetical protein